MSIKKKLEALTKEKAPGPYPTFRVFHVIKTLDLLANFPVGRGLLAKKLGIGEGAARTLIERLKKEGIIFISKQGCSLTQKGKEFWKEIKKVFPSKIQLEESKLTLSTCNVAILVKAKGNKVKFGMEQRDAAFLAGATGATTLVMKEGKLTMPSVNRDIAKDFPQAYKKIMSTLKPEESDVVVIGSAHTWEKAEYGAIGAAWTLLNNYD